VHGVISHLSAALQKTRLDIGAVGFVRNRVALKLALTDFAYLTTSGIANRVVAQSQNENFQYRFISCGGSARRSAHKARGKFALIGTHTSRH
jgi:hypothetical protein